MSDTGATIKLVSRTAQRDSRAPEVPACHPERLAVGPGEPARSDLGPCEPAQPGPCSPV